MQGATDDLCRDKSQGSTRVSTPLKKKKSIKGCFSRSHFCAASIFTHALMVAPAHFTALAAMTSAVHPIVNAEAVINGGLVKRGKYNCRKVFFDFSIDKNLASSDVPRGDPETLCKNWCNNHKDTLFPAKLRNFGQSDDLKVDICQGANGACVTVESKIVDQRICKCQITILILRLHKKGWDAVSCAYADVSARISHQFGLKEGSVTPKDQCHCGSQPHSSVCDSNGDIIAVN